MKQYLTLRVFRDKTTHIEGRFDTLAEATTFALLLKKAEPSNVYAIAVIVAVTDEEV